jgi:hypothetical protein
MAEFRQTILYQKSQWDDDQKAMKAQQKKFIEDIKRDHPGAKIIQSSYKKTKGGSKTAVIDNPIEDADYNTAFRLESKEKQFYLKFGYLLEYIAENILPRIKIGEIHANNPSIFKVDYNEWSNHMYSFPNQISLDPRVCLVRNSNFNSGRGNTQILQQLSIFREADNGESDASANAAYPMNIYLNFNFILECLKSDDRGDVNVFEFISAICTGLNKALGGINNLEPIIEEESNTLRIIDTTPIPGYSNSSPSKEYTLQLYGYHKSGGNYTSNFVRNVDLKTAITPEFATMITVGATAGGYVKGTEATAFSKWNVGLLDRYKEEFTPGNISSVKKSQQDDEAEVTYVNEFLIGGYVTRYGLTSLTGDFNLSPDAIERNISVVTEYYKYIIAKESIDQSTSGGTVGFIPFKLGITLDGISGIKIYNKLEVNTEFLPKAYGKTVDLIVTGVSHNLSGNDWETQIETTVIPKTGKQSVISISANVIQESVKKVNSSKTITSCNQLPPSSGLSSSVKGLIKASTTKDSTIVQAIVDNLEGGYYHPTHAYDSSTKLLKTSFEVYKNSGETLYGIDRFAGNTEGIKQGPINQTGVAFWSAVDAISGFGAYKATARITKTGGWNIVKNPRKSNGWSWNYMPKPSDPGYNTLQTNLQKYISHQFTSFSKTYFGNHPVGKLVESDGRLKFLFYRATWNGVGFFKKYANNLKAVYDSGVTDIDKLICADLTFRYNKKSSAFKPGVSKMAYMIDYKKP